MSDEWRAGATELPLDATAQYLLELAQRWAVRFGQELAFDHLLYAVLERHLAMAEDAVPGVEWHDLRSELRDQLRAGQMRFGGGIEDAVRRAGELAKGEGAAQVRVRHLVRAVAELAAEKLSAPAAAEAGGGGAAQRQQRSAERTASGQAGQHIDTAAVEEEFEARWKPSPTPFLDSVGVDLTEEARNGKLPPVIGREREIDIIIEVLCRRYKRNPLLIGPAGVGKTAIVEGLAQRIAAGDVPEPLQGARIIQITPTGLVRGMDIDGTAEERVRKLVKEASQPGVILFIDEIHRLVGAGGMPGLHDLGQRLKPALARGEIACIGATTEAEYREYIAHDRALARRFQPLRIDELSSDATREIVSSLAAEWAKQAKVRVPPEVVDAVVELSGQYMPNRRFPDKAITLLDTVLTRAQVSHLSEVSGDLVRETVYNLVGALPEEELARRLETLEEYLNEHVYGQPEAAALIADVLRVTMRGLDIAPQRPNAVFVFAGPPSVGKRTMARAIAEHLFDAPDRVLTLEMVRYQQEHAMYELIGAPPGYVGYDEGGKLDWINDVRAGVIILDNLQAAHPRVVTLFEEIFDVGVITNMRGERLYFSDAIFIITCDIRTERRRQIGFEVASEDPSIEKEVRQLLSDSLLDRVDAICPFYPLTPEVVRRIVRERILPALIEQARDKGIEIQVSDEAVGYLAEQAYSDEQGLQRAAATVQRLVLNPVLDVVGLAGTGAGTVSVELKLDDGRLVAVRKSQEEGA